MLRSIPAITLVSLLAASQVSFAGGNPLAKQILKQVAGHVQKQVIQNQGPPAQFQQVSGGHNHGYVPQQVIIGDGGGHAQLAYFSKRLGARFEIQWIRIGNFNPVLAARIVSTPAPGSPLRQLGLDVGDVITRLDGNPVRSTCELERHLYDTQVRYVKAGADHVHIGTMFIQPNQFFPEPYYPGAGGGNCHGGVSP